MARGNWSDDTAIDGFLTWMQMARGRSLRTLEVYRMALNRLKAFMAGRSILTAEKDELEVFCGLWLHKQGVVALSRKPYISAVRGFYTWCRVNGVIEMDMGEDLVYPKTGRNLPNTITLANAERLVCAPDLGTFRGIRDSAIFHVLIGCGLRVTGLVDLNEGDLVREVIDKRDRLMVRVMEKGNRERLLPLPREAEAILLVYLGHEELAEIDRNTVNRQKRNDKVLFVSTRNSTVTEDAFRGEERRLSRQAVHELLQKYGTPLGIPPTQLHPHAFRHIFGTELTEEDVPTAQVQNLLGHMDPKSTAIYIELSMRKKTRVVDQHGPLAKIRTPVSELLKRLPG